MSIVLFSCRVNTTANNSATTNTTPNNGSNNGSTIINRTTITRTTNKATNYNRTTINRTTNSSSNINSTTNNRTTNKTTTIIRTTINGTTYNNAPINTIIKSVQLITKNTFTFYNIQHYSQCSYYSEINFSAAVPSCGHNMRPTDIAILLDSTHSITKNNWPVMKQFVKDVTNRVNFGPNDVWVPCIHCCLLQFQYLCGLRVTFGHFIRRWRI